MKEGDHVVVAPGWGDGTCRHCLVGNTQICANVRWPGFGAYGGFAEFIPVPARYMIKVDKRLKFEEIAPLTDAGLTPYRGIKKLRNAGVLGPDRVIGVFGVGGLGAYAVQYAKLLGSGARVVAFARNPEKLSLAREYGADDIININGGKSIGDIVAELRAATGQGDIDAAIDCAGAARPWRSQPDYWRLAVTTSMSASSPIASTFRSSRASLVNRPSRGLVWGNNTDLSRGDGFGRQEQDPPYDRGLLPSSKSIPILIA